MKIDPTKQYQTRDGRAVTNLRPNPLSGCYPWEGQVGALDGGAPVILSWDDRGVFYMEETSHPADLVEVADPKPAGFDLLEDVIPCATLSQISEAVYGLERTCLVDPAIPHTVFWSLKKIRHMLEPHVCSRNADDRTPGAHDNGVECAEQPGLTDPPGRD